MTNHVPSLELCRQLKEAGYPQEGTFWWNAHDRLDKEKNITYIDNFSLDYNFNKWGNVCGGYESIVAPLASELMERLPQHYHIWKSSCMENDLGDWICVEFSEPEFEYGEHIEQGDTICNALAKMWLYLLKEKLI